MEKIAKLNIKLLTKLFKAAMKSEDQMRHFELFEIGKPERMHRWRGAGLVEYALILALIALGSIIILGLVGVGAQRIYGIVGGILGIKKDAGEIPSQVINITGADCYVIAKGSSYNGGAYAATGYTAYFLKVDTNLAVDQLNMAGTESTLMLNVFDPETTIVPAPGISHITFTMDGVYAPDASRCPKTAVVQSLQGSIAISPITVVTIN